MKHKKILVYIEGEGGGGTTSKRKYLDGEFRNAWKQFLQPLADQAKNRGIVRFQCVPGRGGSTAVDTFSKPLPEQEGTLRILIIDSEGPVSDSTRPWNALKKKCPEGTDDKNCYLMVQCLETWLLADVDSLKRHYNRNKKCFRDNKLRVWPNLETITRKILQGALEKATSECQNPYAHADGNLLIALVDRNKLRTLSSVARLFKDFAEKIDEYAAA